MWRPWIVRCYSMQLHWQIKPSQKLCCTNKGCNGTSPAQSLSVAMWVSVQICQRRYQTTHRYLHGSCCTCHRSAVASGLPLVPAAQAARVICASVDSNKCRLAEDVGFDEAFNTCNRFGESMVLPLTAARHSCWVWRAYAVAGRFSCVCFWKLAWNTHTNNSWSPKCCNVRKHGTKLANAIGASSYWWNLLLVSWGWPRWDEKCSRVVAKQL